MTLNIQVATWINALRDNKDLLLSLANPSYQRRPSSLNRWKEMCTFPTNLRGAGRSARPTSR